MSTQELRDIAGKQYWDKQWEASGLPDPIGLLDAGLGNHTNRSLDRFYREALSGMSGKGLSLLEVGCAQSVWLPYFANEFGFKVTGLDYSEHGCEKERRILAAAGLNGTVICGDLRSPPAEMCERFDVVVSFGVLEHFSDTVRCVVDLAYFLKPGGTIITLVPNMCGMLGWAQRIVSESVYRTHVPIDAGDLRHAHELSHIDVRTCRYLLSANFYAVNHARSRSAKLSAARNWLLMSLLKLFTKAAWLFEMVAFALPESRLMSPYVVCVGTKECQ